MTGIRKSILIFLCCLLGVPTCAYFLPGIQAPNPEVLYMAGAMLGLFHICLRPIARFFTKPLGCITFGLIGPLVDTGLLYLCARTVKDFSVLSFWQAVLAALGINAVIYLLSGRK